MRVTLLMAVGALLLTGCVPVPVETQTNHATPLAVPKVAMRSAYPTTAAAAAALWLAKDAGYFDEEGLDVTLTRIEGGAPLMAAMLNGEVPIAGSGGPPIVDANLEGADFVVVADLVEASIASIYVDPSIERPDQLKGKALGVTNFGSLTHIAGQVGIRQLGLTAAEVTFVATGGPPETLAAIAGGRVQGGVISPPETLKARQMGLRELLNLAKADPQGSLAMGVTTTRRWAHEHPDLVTRYVRAVIKASHRFQTDRELATTVIAKYTETTDPQVLDETYDAYRDSYSKTGLPHPEPLEQALDLAAVSKPEARQIRAEQFIDPSFVESLRADGLFQQLWGTDTP